MGCEGGGGGGLEVTVCVGRGFTHINPWPVEEDMKCLKQRGDGEQSSIFYADLQACS